MSWTERMLARLADLVDETAARRSTPTRDYNERVGNRDTRRQVRDEIAAGTLEPRTRLERGSAEHSKGRWS